MAKADDEQETGETEAEPKRKRWAVAKDEEAIVKIREILGCLEDDEQTDMVLTWVLRKWGKISVAVSSCPSGKATT